MIFNSIEQSAWELPFSLNDERHIKTDYSYFKCKVQSSQAYLSASQVKIEYSENCSSWCQFETFPIKFQMCWKSRYQLGEKKPQFNHDYFHGEVTIPFHSYLLYIGTCQTCILTS